jgi:hypothetical protein
MSHDELRSLLGRIPRPSPLHCAWSDAHAEAEHAWRAWRSAPGAAAYAAYRAAADREDAAQDAVAAGR